MFSSKVIAPVLVSPFGFDKQSGSVRGWETDEPRSGCAQAPSLCAGLFSTPASVGDPSPDDR